MIEGIIVCVLLVLALIGLHYWNKPKVVVIDNLPPVTTKVPMPEVKNIIQPPASRSTSINPAFAAQYGKATDWGKAAREEREEQGRRAIRRDAEEREARLRRSRAPYDEPVYDSTPDLMTTAVTAAAAVIVADTIYDSVVDTGPGYDYSSPTPSSSSSSSWGGDSSSSSSYSDSSSSYDSSSSSSDSSSW